MEQPTSTYISMGTLMDPKQHINGELENIELAHFPPEPYFCQPIAKPLSKVIRNTTPLLYLPSSHHHSHDYGMIDQSNILVIVGEALSNTCEGCEHDKCLPGLGHCLSVYELGISMISAWNRLYISIAQIDTAYNSNHQQLPYFNINTVKVVADDYRNDYHHYINQVLNVLELACIAFVNNPGNVDVMSTNHQAITPSNTVPHFDYNKNHEIDMPGVYWGFNSGYVKHEAPGLYDAYIEGWKNRGVISDMYNLHQTKFQNLAVHDLFGNEEEGKENDRVGTVDTVDEEGRVILALCSPTNGPYPEMAINIAGHIKPIRNERFYEQSTPNYNPVDSDDNEAAPKRDPGILII